MDSAEVVLRAEGGASGRLTISRLPTAAEGPELDDRDGTLIVREARKYRFRLAVNGGIAHLEPVELFDFDDESRETGRLVPGESVGLVRVEATTHAGDVLHGCFDVRSAKFSDETAFSGMLSDLARLSVEALHQGFAPSAGQFGSGSGPSPRLLYQQFAVLKSLLDGPELRWALTQVIGRPHRAWVSQLEPRVPGRPLKGSSRLVHQLSRSGPRVPTPLGSLPTLPAQLLVERTDETLDTMPNRYVKFVLEGWRALAAALLANVDQLPGSAMRRGVVEAHRVLEQLDETLGEPLFREVANLRHFPGDNPVLRRREGYRQIYAGAALVDGTLGLDLDIEDPFLVSRRSIATLYEYWTFVRLAGAVAEACGASGVEGDLFKPSGNGMSLVLKAGALTRLKFEATVGQAPVLVDLFFNNEFRRDSWTRPMRPDASLLIRRPGHREVWLHFDAKYRVDWTKPFETGNVAEEEDSERTGASKRTDLLKMHAYRDAIRDSAGSYVLFPGSEMAEFALNDAEFLPGLGAFPLRPERAEEDVEVLRAFVSRVLVHVAGAGTRHRRATYWTAKAYEGSGTEALNAQPPTGELPPADTSVLFGYVRSDEQWAWIHQVGLYNVRSGNRPGAVESDDIRLDAPLILLYRRGAGVPCLELHKRKGAWEAASGESLLRLGYPHPPGATYLVAPIEPVPAPPWLEAVSPLVLQPRAHRFGQPFSSTWLDLILSTQATSGRG